MERRLASDPQRICFANFREGDETQREWKRREKRGKEEERSANEACRDSQSEEKMLIPRDSLPTRRS